MRTDLNEIYYETWAGFVRVRIRSIAGVRDHGFEAARHLPSAL